jgi:hypothetical protein
MEVEIGTGTFGIEYTCAACGSILKREGNLLTHRRYGHGLFSEEDRSKPIRCEWAGHSFAVPTIALRSLAASAGSSRR